MGKPRGRAKGKRAKRKGGGEDDAKIKSLARELKISRVQVWRLVQRGMPTDLDGARAWRAANVETKSGAAAQETQKLRAAQARIAEMQARRLEGELGEVKDFEAALTEVLVTVRTNTEAIAGRCNQQLAGMTDPAEIRTFLLREIRDGLQQAADRVEGWARGLAGGLAPAAKADSKPVAMGGGE